MARIPQNYDDNGNWFGGILKKRNTVEASIWLLGVFLLLYYPLSFLLFKAKMIIFLLLGVPVAIILLIGLGDETITEKIMQALNYQNTKCTVTLRKPQKRED